jgi:hypothetical protein
LPASIIKTISESTARALDVLNGRLWQAETNNETAVRNVYPLFNNCSKHNQSQKGSARCLMLKVKAIFQSYKLH